MNSNGFTLIELMIIVAIIGILTLIGYPLYHNYVLRTKLTELLHEHMNLVRQIEIDFNTQGGDGVVSMLAQNCNTSPSFTDEKSFSCSSADVGIASGASLEVSGYDGYLEVTIGSLYDSIGGAKQYIVILADNFIKSRVTYFVNDSDNNMKEFYVMGIVKDYEKRTYPFSWMGGPSGRINADVGKWYCIFNSYSIKDGFYVVRPAGRPNVCRDLIGIFTATMGEIALDLAIKDSKDYQ